MTSFVIATNEPCVREEEAEADAADELNGGRREKGENEKRL